MRWNLSSNINMRLVVLRLLWRLAPRGRLILPAVNGVDPVGTLHLVLRLFVPGGAALLRNLVPAELAVLLDAQHFLLMDGPENRVGKGIDFENTKTGGAKVARSSIGRIGASTDDQNAPIVQKNEVTSVESTDFAASKAEIARGRCQRLSNR